MSAILVNVPQKQAAYNASKAAQVHLAKSLAVEWADFARVNCISPVSGRRMGTWNRAKADVNGVGFH